MPGRKLIVRGRAANPATVQRRQELARARAEFEALKSEKTLVKIRWEHKPQKMLWGELSILTVVLLAISVI